MLTLEHMICMNKRKAATGLPLMLTACDYQPIPQRHLRISN